MTGWDTLISDGDVTDATVDVPFCLDRQLVKALTDAQTAFATALEASAEGSVRDSTTRAQRVVDDAAEAVAAAQTIITLRSLPESEWKALKGKHPPSAEQRKEGHVAHPDKFPPAAVQACIVRVNHRGTVMEGQPPMSWVTDHLKANLTDGEWSHLTAVVHDLNRGSIDVGKLAAAIGTRRSSEPSSTTAAPEESPTASSPKGE